MKRSNLILVLIVILLLVVIGILVFDYFSDSFNLIFGASKSPAVVIYGNPSVGNGISFE